MDIRATILDRMKTRKLSAYKLAKLVSAHVGPATVYDYVAGRADMTGERLGHLLAALDLTVR